MKTTAVHEVELILSQEDQTQTHRSTRQISSETGLTQSSIVQIIHRNLGLQRSCALQYVFVFRLRKRLFPIIASFSDIDISQGSVKTYLWCGGNRGIYNNRVIANCPQSVPVKEF